MSKVKERINRYFDAVFPIILYRVLEETKAVELLKTLTPSRRIIEWSISECKDTTIPDLDDYTLDGMLSILYEDASLERLSVKCWGIHPTSLLWHQSYVWLVPFFLLKSRIRTLNLPKWRSP